MTQISDGEPDVLELADRFFDAIERNDSDALRQIYTPDVTVWHNHDRKGQDLETNLKVLSWLHRNVSDKRYDEVRRMPTATGFVEQHVLRGTTKTGKVLDVPACLVITVTGGRISRIEEYVDSADLAALA